MRRSRSFAASTKTSSSKSRIAPSSCWPLSARNAIEQLLRDDGFLAHMDRVVADLQNYLDGHTWFQETYGSRGSDKDAVA